ncbi:MAG TPA: hypothetical protein VN665_00605 [Candidatus Paceibacterota bacterium]|nr:hypothetical protein [Candidatus Paceibacterota bacterium]
MVKPEIVGGNLVLTVEGADKFFALKSQLVIPLVHIVDVRLDDEIVKRWWRGIKFPGTNLPGVITAGSFYQDGKRIFWDIHHPEFAVVISLTHESYNELVIEVEDPRSFIRDLYAVRKP